MREIDKRECEQLAESGKALPVTGAEEAKVTYFNKTFWQDVLEEATDELFGVESRGSEGAGVGGAIAEGDLAVGQFENAAVADSDAEDVRGQVL